MTDEPKPNFLASMFGRALAGTLKHVKEKGSGLGEEGFLKSVLEDEKVQTTGAELISSGLNDTFDDITKNAGPLIKVGAEKLNPENKDSYRLIRESLGPPSDGIFKKIIKTIFGRILNVGSGIVSYIGATFVNKLFNPTENVEGADVHNIFASFISKIAGSRGRAGAMT